MRAFACVHGTPDLVLEVLIKPCRCQLPLPQRQIHVEGLVVVLQHFRGHTLRTVVHGGRRKVCDVHAARGRHAWHARRARGLLRGLAHGGAPKDPRARRSSRGGRLSYMCGQVTARGPCARGASASAAASAMWHGAVAAASVSNGGTCVGSGGAGGRGRCGGWPRWLGQGCSRAPPEPSASRAAPRGPLAHPAGARYRRRRRSTRGGSRRRILR